MQRRTSQTFQRIRKLSDSIIQAVIPSSSGKPNTSDSFFDYGKKGWHHPKPPDSSLRRRPSHRKVSKEEIRYPLLHPTDTLDLWVESATMCAEREKQQRPARPSLEERPLVVRDPQLRMEEQRIYRSMNTAKRPERPREEDLPYGARGSIPKALMGEQRHPPPAAAVGRSSAHSNSVPFPSHAPVRDERGARVTRRLERDAPLRGHRDRETMEDEVPPTPPPKEPLKMFSPFAVVSPHEVQERRAQAAPAYRSELTRGASSRSAPEPPYGTSSARSRPYGQDLPAEGEHRGRHREPARPDEDMCYTSTGPTQVRRQGAIRRTSSSGDVNLPPQHSRYRPERRDENEPRRTGPLPPELRTVKSSPLSSRQPSLSARTAAIPVPVPVPVHPAAHLRHVRGKPGSRDLDVPRDVSPEPDNPQRLPTPRKSAEEPRPAQREHTRERERERERGQKREPLMLIPPAPVATAAVVAKAQACMRMKESSAPRAVKVSASPEGARPVSYSAQVVRPEPQPERAAPRDEDRKDRARRRHEERARDKSMLLPKTQATRGVQYYGEVDAFARQIALALAEPERAEPISSDWSRYAAGGQGYGTKPLAPRKSVRR